MLGTPGCRFDGKRFDVVDIRGGVSARLMWANSTRCDVRIVVVLLRANKSVVDLILNIA